MSRLTDRIFPLCVRLLEERPDLRELFDPDDPEGRAGLWFWLNWHGVDPAMCTRASEVVEALWPMPPESLIHRVVGETSDLLAFRQGGLVDWRRMWTCLRDSGLDFESPATVLDFGVGCARILRYFGLYADHWELHGADVDPDAIAWDDSELDLGHFHVLDPQGPAPFEDERFDVIYAFSVFTHLPEDRHLAWLQELARISRPGARLILTTMGQTCIDRITSGAHPSPHPSPEVLEAALPQVRRKGFGFFPYDMRVSTWKDEGNTSYFRSIPDGSYGTTVILESYVRECWSRFFEVESFLAGPDEWQDYVTLRRR